MKSRAVLTERDLKFLNVLSVAGVAKYEQAKEVYGSEQYYYRRVQKLIERGYVLKNGRFLKLSLKGREALGADKVVKPSESMWDVYSILADLYLKLTNWQMNSLPDTRMQYNLTNRVHLKATISNGNLYSLYILKPETSYSYLNKVKAEMSAFRYVGFFERSVVFACSEETMSKFGTDPLGLKELWLLPYSHGILVLNSMGSEEYRTYIRSVIPDRAFPSSEPFADFEDDEFYYTVLVTNDLVRRERLAYYTRTQTKPVKLIVLDSQAEFFAKLFPQAGIIPVQDELPKSHERS